MSPGSVPQGPCSAGNCSLFLSGLASCRDLALHLKSDYHRGSAAQGQGRSTQESPGAELRSRATPPRAGPQTAPAPSPAAWRLLSPSRGPRRRGGVRLTPFRHRQPGRERGAATSRAPFTQGRPLVTAGYTAAFRRETRRRSKFGTFWLVREHFGVGTGPTPRPCVGRQTGALRLSAPRSRGPNAEEGGGPGPHLRKAPCEQCPGLQKKGPAAPVSFAPRAHTWQTACVQVGLA